MERKTISTSIDLDILKTMNEILPRKGRTNFINQALREKLATSKEELIKEKAFREARKLMNAGEGTIEIKNGTVISQVKLPDPRSPNADEKP